MHPILKFSFQNPKSYNNFRLKISIDNMEIIKLEDHFQLDL